jgi:exosortase A
MGQDGPNLLRPAYADGGVSTPSASVGAGGAPRRELTVLALVGAVIAFVVILYADTFASMAAIWQSSGYRHGLMVPPVCAYLLWRLRGPLAATDLRPCAWGIAALIAVVALWFVAKAVAVQAVEYLAAALLVPCSVIAFLGWPLARRALFPLLFLIAAVPIGDGLLPHLMLITADISTWLLRAVGVPVFREGQILSLPGGTFEVASVCAGLSYLTAGTVMALLFSYVTYRSWLRRTVFVAATVITVVLTNGIRAFAIMYIASASDMRYLTGRDHVLFGWVLFGAAIFALMYVGMRFADDTMFDAQPAGMSGAQGTKLSPLVLVFGLMMLAATAQPLLTGIGAPWLWLWPATGLLLWTLYKSVNTRQLTAMAVMRGVPYRSLQGVLVLCIAPFVLAAGPGLLPQPGPARQGGPLRVELSSIDGCVRSGSWSEGWEPEFHLPDRVLSGAYRCSGRPVNVFVATYAENVQGRELVNDTNKVVPDSMRGRADPRRFDFTSKDGDMIRVNELEVSETTPSSLVWYWYRTGNTAATSPLLVKFRQALDLLLMRQREGAAYVLHTTIDDALDTSRERLAHVARGLAHPEPAATVGNVSWAGSSSR